MPGGPAERLRPRPRGGAAPADDRRKCIMVQGRRSPSAACAIDLVPWITDCRSPWKDGIAANPQALSGDAGTRQYFRVDHPLLGSALVVLYPPADPASADDAYYEYRALQAYLDPVVRVATIIQFDDELRAMLLEDLGRTTLEMRLTAHPEEELQWAQEAAQLLATWLGPAHRGGARPGLLHAAPVRPAQVPVRMGLLQGELLRRVPAEGPAALAGPDDGGDPRRPGFPHPLPGAPGFPRAQPDGARRPADHPGLPGRAQGRRHLRPGLDPVRRLLGLVRGGQGGPDRGVRGGAGLERDPALGGAEPQRHPAQLQGPRAPSPTR